MDTPVTPVNPKAYSYVRFSTPQQAKGDSQRRQTDKAAQYAAGHGLVLDTELNLTDLGVSGYRLKNAKTGALGAFLRAVEEGRAASGSYLLIENMDRLTRTEIIGATGLFLNLIHAGIVVVTLTNGEEYSQARFDKDPYAIHYIVGELIRANQESFRKGQMVSDAKERKRKRLVEGGQLSKPYTMQTPAWIKWSAETQTYELIPERAAVVREVFEKADTGRGMDGIARELNKRGETTWTRGGRQATYWRGAYLRKIVASTAPLGLFTLHKTTHDKETGARRDVPLDAVALWPAAVDEELYWRVRRRLQTTAPRGRNQGRKITSLVAGVAKCTCGGTVIRVTKGQRKGKHYAYLLCSKAHAKAKGCEYLPVRYDAVEEALRSNRKAIVRHAPRGKNTVELEKEIENLQGYAHTLESDVADLADLAAHERTPAATKRFRDKERELEQHRATLRELWAQKETLTTASVRARLEALKEALGREPFNVADANHALRQAMLKIVVDPKGAMLEIHWHHSEQIEEVPFYSRHKEWTEGAR
jgi:DNA invertase Pin-like site-specific DNA recombinase